ncbi:MAG TPA: PH domain-containing protein [Patescibacteria group bacterium]|jgi:membrane protein YdbS with pleckstrin-like domain
MLNPFDITIQNQADDEEIVRVWRHHPVTLVPPALRVIAFALIPLALLFITGFALFGSALLFGLFVVILALVLTYAAYEWVSWWGDVYILTNYRIIDVEQRGFFHRSFSEATLGKIQDISHEVSGFLPTVFNFGNVLVQTAGSLPNIDLNDVKKPQDQALYLLRAQQAYLENEDKDISAGELIELLTKHRGRLDELAEEDRKRRKDGIGKQMDKNQGKGKPKKR